MSSNDETEARARAEAMTALLADLEAGKAAPDGVTVTRMERADIDTPLPPGYVSCSGCGCWCTSIGGASAGAGHGCGPNGGSWSVG